MRKTIVTTPYGSNFEESTFIDVKTPILVVVCFVLKISIGERRYKSWSVGKKRGAVCVCGFVDLHDYRSGTQVFGK